MICMQKLNVVANIHCDFSVVLLHWKFEIAQRIFFTEFTYVSIAADDAGMSKHRL